MADDFLASTSTTGSVPVGGSATGNIEIAGDADWFAISLFGGTTYRFDLEGSATAQGTLASPQLELRNGAGTLLLSDTNSGGVTDDGWSSRLTYTATATATFYLASDPLGNSIGTYRVTATDTAASSNHAPSITSNGGGNTASVLLPENTFTVTAVTASDIDSGTSLAFSISGGADSGQFQIDAETGALSFIAAPDFKNPTDVDHNNTYVVHVRASDGSLFDDQIISVNISDVRTIRSDFNGDAHSDILLQNASTGACYIWEQDGTSRVAEGPVGWTPGAAWQAKDTGDYNGDGKSDILLQNANTGECFVWELNGTSLVGSGAVGWTPGAAWQAKATGDFNGDGKSDIVLQNVNTGDVYIWELDGTTLAGHGAAGWTPGAAWQVKAAGDYNGDGKSDILLQNANTGACYIWELDGTSLVGHGAAGWTPGAAWQAKDGGDFNGDGMSDILLQNANTGDAYMWLMNGTSLIGNGPAGWTPGADWHIL